MHAHTHAGFLVYIGYFDERLRRLLMQKWKKYLTDLCIPYKGDLRCVCVVCVCARVLCVCVLCVLCVCCVCVCACVLCVLCASRTRRT